MNIKKMHNYLNDLFTKAQNTYTKLINLDYPCRLIFADKNYIKIDGNYEIQHYPIPIIEIEHIGDIGINIDSIFFEFSFSKNDFESINLDLLINDYVKLEIYGGKNCMMDFYYQGDSIEDIKNRIKLSTENTLMLSIYFELNEENIVNEFSKIIRLLNLNM